MKFNKSKFKKSKFGASFAILPLSFAIASAIAQEVEQAENIESQVEAAQTEPTETVEEQTSNASEENSALSEKTQQNTVAVPNPIEEVLILGRIQSAAQDIQLERMENESIADLLDSEAISRVGDPNVASAVRRLPGITLVDGKFIYIRGLGERFSSTTLNGAAVPSPDLTRNVIPLDIFPTSILQSLKVSKGYTSDMPAAFGGGNIDIRTKGMPDGPVLSFDLGSGWNSNDSDPGFGYYIDANDSLGDADSIRALPVEVSNAIHLYQGSLAAVDIESYNDDRQNEITIFDAQQINREIATSLNKNVVLRNEDDLDQEFSGKLNGGYRTTLDNGLDLGFLVGASYSTDYKNEQTIERSFGAPDQEFSTENSTTRTVDLTYNVAAGALLDDENRVDLTHIFIRNTDDEASKVDYFDSNSQFSDASGFRNTETEYEQRELTVTQLTGKHRLGYYFDDHDRLGFLNDLESEWFISEAEATTYIPGAYTLYETTNNDPVTGEVLSTSVDVAQLQRLIDYRYTDLQDQVDSSGIELSLPLEFGNMDLVISGGTEFTKKGRSYRQTDLFIGADRQPADLRDILGLPFNEFFADENILNPDYGFSVSLNSASARSYLAGTTNTAAFGQLNATWDDTIRIVAGLRWEEYVQVGLPWQPYNFDTSQITTDPDELEDATFKEDELYPSLSVTYMLTDFMEADDFQLRFDASKTVVRPDLREITETSYQDPLTGFIVSGNADVIPAELENFDFRAEWFYGSGDNFTVSLYRKGILNPIEFFEVAASDNKRASTIYNTEKAFTHGVEFEWLLGLRRFHEMFEPLFIQGNVTLAESEVVVGNEIPVDVTTDRRSLKGASDYVANIILGFDSDSGQHAATLVYNVFGERLFAAGINGNPDSYEQPFNSLDATYSWYPTEQFTLSAKLKNILDENKTIEDQGPDGRTVETFSKTVGTSFDISVKYSFY